MTDMYEGRVTQLQDPAIDAAVITPDDNADLSFTTRAIAWNSGTLRVITRAGTDMTLPSFLAGQIIPLRVKRVADTETTATEIVGFW